MSRNPFLQDTESVFFVVQNIKELKAYLFQPDMDYTSTAAGRTFDLVDIVFINTDFGFVPWAAENREVGRV